MGTRRTCGIAAVAGALVMVAGIAAAQTPVPTPFPRAPVVGTIDAYVYAADFTDAAVSCGFDQIDAVAAEVAAFYAATSFGQLTIVPHVIQNPSSPDGHFHVDHPCSDLLTDTQRYDTEFWSDIQSATGLDLYALAGTGAKVVQEYACFRGGMGERDGSGAQVGRCWDPVLLAHELGHTFGMGHASRNRRPGSRSGEYAELEVMGHGALATELNAPHRMQLGWLSSGQIVTVADATSVTVTAIDATDPASADTAIVRIPKSADFAGSPMSRNYYYLSFESGRVLIHGIELAPGDVYANELILGNTLYMGKLRMPGNGYRDRSGRFTVRWTGGDAVHAQLAIDVVN
jgi:hypothetical protein